jgi:hypothetical protein
MLKLHINDVNEYILYCQSSINHDINAINNCVIGIDNFVVDILIYWYLYINDFVVGIININIFALMCYSIKKTKKIDLFYKNFVAKSVAYRQILYFIS